jgi:hypothetical protein
MVEGAQGVIVWVGENGLGVEAFCQAAQDVQTGSATEIVKLHELEAFAKSFQELGRLPTGEDLLDECVLLGIPKVVLYAGHQRFESAMIQKVLEALHAQTPALGKKEGASAAASL